LKRCLVYSDILISLLLVLPGCGGIPTPNVIKTIEVAGPTVTKIVEMPAPTVTKTIEVPGPTIYATVTPSAVVVPPVSTSSSSLATIDPNVIVADYLANAIAADLKYKGKVFTVRGIIDDLGTDYSGNPFVDFKTNTLFKWFRCKFPPSQLNTLASLSKGGTLTIVGTCEEYTMGFVNFKDCQIK
jgi:hypothetical protein